MRILGVDPGLVRTGFGVISVQKENITLIDYGVVKPKPSDALPTRLITIFDDMNEIITRYSPGVMVIEDIFYGKNIRSTLLLGQARGAAILAGARREIPIYEYSPRKIKQALTGNGNANKRQVQFMVQSILGLSEVPTPEDASDALAISICHVQQFRSGDL